MAQTITTEKNSVHTTLPPHQHAWMGRHAAAEDELRQRLAPGSPMSIVFPVSLALSVVPATRMITGTIILSCGRSEVGRVHVVVHTARDRRLRDVLGADTHHDAEDDRTDLAIWCR